MIKSFCFTLTCTHYLSRASAHFLLTRSRLAGYFISFAGIRERSSIRGGLGMSGMYKIVTISAPMLSAPVVLPLVPVNFYSFCGAEQAAL